MTGSGQEEWGAWIVHDGLGCPVRAGTIVEVVSEDGFGFAKRYVALASGDPYSSWNWKFYPELMKIIRYRVKTPRGMAILEEILFIPEKTRESDPVGRAGSA